MLSRTILLLILASGVSAQDFLDWQIRGEALQIDQMELFGLDFRDIVAEPRKDGKTLTFTNLSAAAYGGRVTGTFGVHIVDGDLHLDLDLVAVDLGDFLEAFAGVGGYEGKVDGHVTLHMPRARWSRSKGEGRLRLREGSVIHAPGVADLLFGDPGARQHQDNGLLDVTIRRGQVGFRQLVVENDSYQVQGRGHVDRFGNLDITVSPFARMEHVSGNLPVVGDPLGFMLNRLSGRVGRFDVRGHISSPTILFRPF